MIKASVIVANNRPGWLFPAAAKEEWMEIIRVDNGINEPGNPCWARNYGARKAKGKYLVFLDNDVTVTKGWLDQAVKFMDKHPKVGAGQLKLLRMGTNKFDSAGDLITGNGFLAERAREAEDRGQFDKADKIFSGKGAAMIVRKNVFEKVGGFDEDYVYYWEEPDLFWRIWQAGYEVRFLWMGQAYHAYGTKAKPIPKVPAAGQVYLACRNQLMTIIKNAQSRRLRMLFWVSLSWLGLEILFLFTGRFRQAWAIERAWFWLVRYWPKRQPKGDEGWINQVLVKKRLSWYVGKGLAYISGRPF